MGQVHLVVLYSYFITLLYLKVLGQLGPSLMYLHIRTGLFGLECSGFRHFLFFTSIWELLCN